MRIWLQGEESSIEADRESTWKVIRDLQQDCLRNYPGDPQDKEKRTRPDLTSLIPAEVKGGILLEKLHRGYHRNHVVPNQV